LLQFEGTCAEVQRQCTLQITFTLEQVMKAHPEKERYFYSFLNLCTKKAGGWSMP